MSTVQSDMPAARLPVKRGLTLWYALSIVIALILGLASLIGLLYQRVLYPSNVLRQAFSASDWFNLLIGLPVLLGSMWLTQRGKLLGLLCWPAALFYALYVYVPYVIAIPFNVLFPAHLLVVVLSAYALIGLIAAIDGERVSQQLSGTLPLRISAVVFIGLGILVTVRQTAQIFGALAGGTAVGILERATWIDDFIIVPILLAAGALVWRRTPLGYAAAPGLLLGYGMLALGLVPFFVVQARITGQPFDSTGLGMVLVMAALCLVPFAFFARSAAREGSSTET